MADRDHCRRFAGFPKHAASAAAREGRTRSETLAEFNALCDRHGWVQGEALARAIEALKAQLSDTG